MRHLQITITCPDSEVGELYSLLHDRYWMERGMREIVRDIGEE